jgi:hypothetical protein
MAKPPQWMTLQEPREELDRTRPAWDAMDLDGGLADGQLPALSQDAHAPGGRERTSAETE